jgi:bacteriochlorophyll c synthase
MNSQYSLKDKISAHIELLDPITWVGVLQGVICGAIASGEFKLDTYHIGMLALLTLLLGPLGTGFAQSINDYYDRDLDKVNDPVRPIPSGRVTVGEARVNWIIAGFLMLAVGAFLSFYIGGTRGVVMGIIVIVGFVLAYTYSAPPFTLKRNVLVSGPAVGISYSLITWIAGNVLYSDLKSEVVWMAVINALIATGLIFLNDFKSVEGDRKQGMKSLPVMFGTLKTYVVSFILIDVPFSAFVVLAFVWQFQFLFYFSLVSFLIILVAQYLLYADPKEGVMGTEKMVQDVLGDVISRSEVKEHKAYLRYLIVNNFLYIVNVVIAAVMIAKR